MSVHIKICQDAFNAWEVLQAFELAQIKHSKYGANALFIGRMRDFNQNQNVASMRLEHYPGMTEKELSRLANVHFNHVTIDVDKDERDNAAEPSPTVFICHRVGNIEPSDDIVVVAAWSAHRAQAFYLCESIMEDLKSKAPFWKQEQSKEGQTYWVQPS